MVGRRVGIAAALALAVLGLPIASADEPASEPASRQASSTTMKIRLVVGGQEVLATLDDNATARDLVNLLPLTLTLTDYHGIEKVADLPRRLTTEGAPDGFDPAVGDLTYYAPWGNLALFIGDFGYAPGLVPLGRIESGIDILTSPGPLTVTIDRAEDTP